MWSVMCSRQPKAPAMGLMKPLVSNAVAAFKLATTAGPEYAPAHCTAGQTYDLDGSKSAIGPAMSVPTVVGLTSVSRWTVSGCAGSAVQLKSPGVVTEPTGC